MTTGMKGTGATGHASVTGGTEFCKSCLKAGCQVCRAVEGGEDCAFCEDGELCPTRQRIAERAKAAHISERAFKTQAEKENVMDKKLCKCGCGEETSPVREYKNGHRPAAEKKTGGANSAPASSVSSVPQRKPKAAKPKTEREAKQPEALAGYATISVSEANLDAFWGKLALVEKAALFQNHLAGAAE